MKLISSAAISRQYDIFASPKVTTELLPSAFGVHTKNVSSPLRSGEITTAAIPVFGKAETPPALWRRGVQPGSKNGSRFCSCHSPSMREARKYFGFTSWFFRAFRRVAEGVDPYHAPAARFIFFRRRRWHDRSGRSDYPTSIRRFPAPASGVSALSGSGRLRLSRWR